MRNKLIWFLLPVSYIAFSLSIDAARSERDRINQETILALDTIQDYHFSKTRLEKIDSTEILSNFMEELDYNRLFFIENDVNEIMLSLKSTLKNIYLSKGDLYPAFKISQIYKERADKRLKWVFEKLKGEFDFTIDDYYIPDRSEMDWPRDEAAADELWMKRLKFDLLQEILNDNDLKTAREKVERRYVRTQKYINELDNKNFQEMFLTSIANMYDPHSTFFSADTLEEFSNSLKNSLVGIGALLRDEDGYCVIQELIAGGPAETSGKLHPGDKIVAVAQKGKPAVDIIDMKLKKIVKMIRGRKGTEVILTVVPADASDLSIRKNIVLVRDNIQLTENLAEAEVIEVPHGDETIAVGHIELPSFYGTGVGENKNSSTTHDVEELINRLKKHNIQGIVLDLRRNGGGLLKEAISLTGLFITQGPVVQVKDTSGRIREDWDKDERVAYDGPLIVLVSRRSASASEIVAGALQNHKRAIIVGDESTHGKGSVQAIFELDRRMSFSLFSKREKYGAAKVTIQKFYLPSGDSTQHKGVLSDIVIPSINKYLPIGESDLPNALEWDRIDALTWKNRSTPKNININTELIDTLRHRSKERLKSFEEFAFNKQNIEWFKKKQEEEKVSLMLSKRKEEKKQDAAFKDQMEATRSRLGKNRYPAKEVLLGISESKKKQHQEKLQTTLLPNGKPKANQYYQKIYYHLPEGSSEIKEVWVENFDYEKIAKQADKLNKYLNKQTGKDLKLEHLTNILNHFKNGERSADFQYERVFQEEYKDALTLDEIEAALPGLFVEMIKIDPQIIDERPTLDIPLREAIRVLTDWLDIDKNVSPNRVAKSSFSDKEKK